MTAVQTEGPGCHSEDIWLAAGGWLIRTPLLFQWQLLSECQLISLRMYQLFQAAPTPSACIGTHTETEQPKQLIDCYLAGDDAHLRFPTLNRTNWGMLLFHASDATQPPHIRFNLTHFTLSKDEQFLYRSRFLCLILCTFEMHGHCFPSYFNFIYTQRKHLNHKRFSIKE